MTTFAAPHEIGEEEGKPKPRRRQEREQFDIRWTQLETEFSSWRAHYQDISKFLLPRSGRYTTSDRNKGQKRHNDIFDNTGTRSLRTLGSGLMAGATSPARPWVRIVTSDPTVNRSFGVKRWLDEVTKLVLRVFAKSNTYRVLHMMYEELGAFGTAACIVLTDVDHIIHCYPLTAGEYRLATDHRGIVDTCYRTFEMTVAACVREFDLENCSTDVQQAHRQGFLQSTVTVRHVIEPRYNRDPGKLDDLNMAWRSVYYEVGRDEDKFLRESGFPYFPVLAPRWNTIGGDVYGNGPGMEALGDIKQLQHEQIRKAQGIDFQTNPSMLMPAEMKGQEARWLPGGVTFIPSTTQSSGVKPAFEVRLDLEHLLADIIDVRERVKASFFADLFLMLTFQNTSTRMTATEVAERHEEKLIQLGPVLERLHTELLAPLVDITYHELLAGGLLPPAPPEIEDADLTLEFISMLAQAQRAVGVAGIERVLLIAGGVAPLKPDIVDNLDEDELWSELTDMVGVSPRISRSPEARDKIRQAKIAAQDAAMKGAAAEQTSNTVKNLAASPTNTPNALSDVISQFAGYDQPPPRAVG